MKGDKKLHNRILVRKPRSVSYPMALFVATGVETLDSTIRQQAISIRILTATLDESINRMREPSMGTSHRVPKPVSRKQLDN
jgi:hypothetical protein